MSFTCFFTISAQTARTFKVEMSGLSELSGAPETPELTVFLPENPTGRAVVACPGGGYSHLAMEHEGTSWASFFNSRGIALVVLKYRMPKGNRTIPMTDAQNAIRTARDSAEVWHVNPHDIGIMGSSAGGHLAAITSVTAPSETRPDFTILFYPVISMDEKVTHKGSVVNFLGDERGNSLLVEQFSADRQVSKATTPPAIIMLSSDDTVVPAVTNGVAYYNAMCREKVPCALYAYSDGGHGWGIKENFKWHIIMLEELSSWLENLSVAK